MIVLLWDEFCCKSIISNSFAYGDTNYHTCPFFDRLWDFLRDPYDKSKHDDSIANDIWRLMPTCPWDGTKYKSPIDQGAKNFEDFTMTMTCDGYLELGGCHGDVYRPHYALFPMFSERISNESLDVFVQYFLSSFGNGARITRKDIVQWLDKAISSLRRDLVQAEKQGLFEAYFCDGKPSDKGWAHAFAKMYPRLYKSYTDFMIHSNSDPHKVTNWPYELEYLLDTMENNLGFPVPLPMQCLIPADGKTPFNDIESVLDKCETKTVPMFEDSQYPHIPDIILKKCSHEVLVGERNCLPIFTFERSMRQCQMKMRLPLLIRAFMSTHWGPRLKCPMIKGRLVPRGAVTHPKLTNLSFFWWNWIRFELPVKVRVPVSPSVALNRMRTKDDIPPEFRAIMKETERSMNNYIHKTDPKFILRSSFELTIILYIYERLKSIITSDDRLFRKAKFDPIFAFANNSQSSSRYEVSFPTVEKVRSYILHYLLLVSVGHPKPEVVFNWKELTSTQWGIDVRVGVFACPFLSFQSFDVDNIISSVLQNAADCLDNHRRDGTYRNVQGMTVAAVSLPSMTYTFLMRVLHSMTDRTQGFIPHQGQLCVAPFYVAADAGGSFPIQDPIRPPNPASPDNLADFAGIDDEEAKFGFHQVLNPFLEKVSNNYISCDTRYGGITHNRFPFIIQKTLKQALFASGQGNTMRMFNRIHPNTLNCSGFENTMRRYNHVLSCFTTYMEEMHPTVVSDVVDAAMRAATDREGLDDFENTWPAWSPIAMASEF